MKVEVMLAPSVEEYANPYRKAPNNGLQRWFLGEKVPYLRALAATQG